MSPGRTASSGRGEDGSASVELIAVVPLLLAAILAAAQVALAGHALWSASVAARAGARAALVGSDPATVARRALPSALRPGSRIDERAGVVSVQVRLGLLLPGAPEIALGARSGLADPGG